MDTEKKENIDKNSDKYKIILKFINKLLTNINKNEIDNLLDFKDIDREDIIKKENDKLFYEMGNDIFELFDKKKSGYYRKTNARVLNCLRGLLKELGYDFVNKKKEKSQYIDGKSYKRTHMLYTIKKKN